MFRLAVIQMNSRDDKATNLRAAEELIERAAAAGAQMAALPEFFSFLGPMAAVAAQAEPIPGPTVERLQARAQRHGIYLHCGSIAERLDGSGQAANTTVLLGPDGALLGAYRKVHLFDVVAGEKVYTESSHIVPGDRPVVVETPLCKVGLSICYDLRFGELYRSLAAAGAQVIFVPAAFTLYTGKDHWEVLLRARAIENQVFVAAPAQYGSHPPGNQCFGSAMIVNPWGTVVARAAEEPGVVVADIDWSYAERVRAQVPCLSHRRPDVYRRDPAGAS